MPVVLGFELRTLHLLILGLWSFYLCLPHSWDNKHKLPCSSTFHFSKASLCLSPFIFFVLKSSWSMKDRFYYVPVTYVASEARRVNDFWHLILPYV
jgi:hypothetical protein